MGRAAVSAVRYIVGDVREALARLEPRSVDLALTSSPFYSLRSYFAVDDPLKPWEIGQEPTPGMFIDSLLDVVELLDPALTEHGSIVWELGDGYAGSGPGGDDDGQGNHERRRNRPKSLNPKASIDAAPPARLRTRRQLPGFPQDKSLLCVPEAFRLSLIYGYNVLPTPCRRCHGGGSVPDGPCGIMLCPECYGVGERHRLTPAWRARNVVRWARPNPVVGDLGDKFRPATSDLVVLCKTGKRYFDLDAVRTPHKSDPAKFTGNGYTKGNPAGVGEDGSMPGNPAGAPPHDYWPLEYDERDVLNQQIDVLMRALLEHGIDLEDAGDLSDLWPQPTQPYTGAHFAVWPPRLLDKPIKSMCPEKVCTLCGLPRIRLVRTTRKRDGVEIPPGQFDGRSMLENQGVGHWRYTTEREELGWSECGCGAGCRATTWKMVKVLTGELGEDGEPVEKPRRKRVVDDVGECTDPSHWRRGHVLDPFGGSGTTGMVAQGLGRDSTLIDLNPANAVLAESRIGTLFLEIVKVDDL